MFKNIKLSEQDIADIEDRNEKQAQYYKTRAIKIIEQGSDYSSDYEEYEASEYVSSDGEGEKIKKLRMESYGVKNIQVQRGTTLNLAKQRRKSQVIDDDPNDASKFVGNPLDLQATGDFGNGPEDIQVGGNDARIALNMSNITPNDVRGSLPISNDYRATNFSTEQTPNLVTPMQLSTVKNSESGTPNK